jgi:cysteine desulfurase
MLYMSHIYVDHAATTPIHPQVVEAMLPYLQTHFGNPSSIHAFGRNTRSALDAARRTIARQIGIDPGHMVFTSGGTEADNMALIGVAMANKEKGKHIITSQVEHHAVLHTCSYLEELDFEITYLPVDSYGQVKLDDLKEAVREDTILVSIMYGNNEVGTIQPIEEIGQFLRSEDIYFHTDAVQAIGIEPLNVHGLSVDLLSVSSHKVNGPKGIGFLYVAPHVKLKPILFGGAQERNRRAGTENIAAIIGFAEALKLAYEQLDERRKAYISYRNKMLDILRQENIEFELNGHLEHFLPHIVNLSFIGMKADALLMNLDLAGIAASSGSACSAGSLQPSHVIEAMHKDDERVNSAIRFSFGLGNTVEQIEQVARKTAEIIHRMRS